MGFALYAALSLLNPWDLGDPVAPSDLARFPYDAETCALNWRHAVLHCTWVENEAPLVAGLRPALVARHGEGWPELWRQRATYCRECWNHLDNAWRARQYGTADSVARHLRLLRDAVGPQMYAAGQMPPVEPHEFFAEVR